MGHQIIWYSTILSALCRGSSMRESALSSISITTASLSWMKEINLRFSMSGSSNTCLRLSHKQRRVSLRQQKQICRGLLNLPSASEIFLASLSLRALGFLTSALISTRKGLKIRQNLQAQSLLRSICRNLSWPTDRMYSMGIISHISSLRWASDTNQLITSSSQVLASLDSSSLSLQQWAAPLTWARPFSYSGVLELVRSSCKDLGRPQHLPITLTTYSWFCLQIQNCSLKMQIKLESSPLDAFAIDYNFSCLIFSRIQASQFYMQLFQSEILDLWHFSTNSRACRSLQYISTQAYLCRIQHFFISSEQQATVPTNLVLIFWPWVSEINRDRPKSRNTCFFLEGLKAIFYGLMSECTNPKQCRAFRFFMSYLLICSKESSSTLVHFSMAKKADAAVITMSQPMSRCTPGPAPSASASRSRKYYLQMSCSWVLWVLRAMAMFLTTYCCPSCYRLQTEAKAPREKEFPRNSLMVSILVKSTVISISKWPQ